MSWYPMLGASPCNFLSLRASFSIFEPNVFSYWTILAYLMPDHPPLPIVSRESEKRRALRGSLGTTYLCARGIGVLRRW